jgi:hypothetical protein
VRYVDGGRETADRRSVKEELTPAQLFGEISSSRSAFTTSNVLSRPTSATTYSPQRFREQRTRPTTRLAIVTEPRSLSETAARIRIGNCAFRNCALVLPFHLVITLT